MGRRFELILALLLGGSAAILCWLANWLIYKTSLYIAIVAIVILAGFFAALAVRASGLARSELARRIEGMLHALASRLKPKRQWSRFSLSTLLLALTVLCISLGVIVNRANRQHNAVAAIQALDGQVIYMATEGFPRSILRRWLPRDYVDGVQAVDLRPSGRADAALAKLHALKGVQWLYLDDTSVTDAGLANLEGVTSLEGIWLRGTQVTDAGLASLQRLNGLRGLYLGGTRITDVGLVHLKGMTVLRVLDLRRTQITDEGLVQLRALTGLRDLLLSDTQVTDGGTIYLQGLVNLRSLWLDHTRVTDAEVARFRQAMPKCLISGR